MTNAMFIAFFSRYIMVLYAYADSSVQEHLPLPGNPSSASYANGPGATCCCERSRSVAAAVEFVTLPVFACTALGFAAGCAHTTTAVAAAAATISIGKTKDAVMTAIYYNIIHCCRPREQYNIITTKQHDIVGRDNLQPTAIVWRKTALRRFLNGCACPLATRPEFL